MRNGRTSARKRASGRSVVTPSPPASCIARSITRKAASETKTLATDVSCARRAPGVERLRRRADQRAARVEVDHRVGDEALGEAELLEPGAEHLALGGAVERDVERPPGEAQPAHAVRQPRGPEPDLRVAEALPHLAEHRVVPATTQSRKRTSQCPPANTRVGRLHVAADLEAGVAGVDEEHRRALRRARHADGEGRAVGAGDEPLVAVDHPAVAVAPRRGGERRRVGARPGMRLGHREAGADLAARQRGAGSAPSAPPWR